MTELNGRQIVDTPGGDDPYAHLIAVADAIAALPDVFDHEGSLVQLLSDGALGVLNRERLVEIGQNRLATRRLVNRGSEAAPKWTVNYEPVHIDEITVRGLLLKPGHEGGLKGRIAKA
jgi:hypothetical protein